MISSKPEKSRKAQRHAPLHRKHKKLTVPLSQDLKEKEGIKRLPVRTGDTVKIVRGNNRGSEGSVQKVIAKKERIYVEGVNIAKSDGSERFYPVHPSNVIITKLEKKDEKRKKVMER